MEQESKRLTLELKDDGEAGVFRAVFSSFNTVDSHGDVALPGAFRESAQVLIGAYNHNGLSLPIGKGVIHSDENLSWVDGRFNLNTQLGRDTYEAVKDAGDLMEWSYVYRPLKVSFGDHDGKHVRFLEEVDVWSVDPVLKGAGVLTGTVAIKSGIPFAEHADAARAAVTAFVERAKSLADLRADDGRTIGAKSAEVIAELRAALAGAEGDLAALIPEPPKETSDINLAAEAMRYQRSIARLRLP